MLITLFIILNILITFKQNKLVVIKIDSFVLSSEKNFQKQFLVGFLFYKIKE